MSYTLLADLTVLIHAAFILFAVFGGFAVMWRPQLIWLHLPAAAWGVFIELSGGVCPLTHLEVRWRLLGGEQGYTGSFIQQYLEPLIYPAGIAPEHQTLLGIIVLLVNSAVYAAVWRRHHL